MRRCRARARTLDGATVPGDTGSAMSAEDVEIVQLMVWVAEFDDYWFELDDLNAARTTVPTR